VRRTADELAGGQCPAASAASAPRSVGVDRSTIARDPARSPSMQAPIKPLDLGTDHPVLPRASRLDSRSLQVHAEYASLPNSWSSSRAGQCAGLEPLAGIGGEAGPSANLRAVSGATAGLPRQLVSRRQVEPIEVSRMSPRATPSRRLVYSACMATPPAGLRSIAGGAQLWEHTGQREPASTPRCARSRRSAVPPVLIGQLDACFAVRITFSVQALVCYGTGGGARRCRRWRSLQFHAPSVTNVIDRPRGAAGPVRREPTPFRLPGHAWPSSLMPAEGGARATAKFTPRPCDSALGLPSWSYCFVVAARASLEAGEFQPSE